MVAVRKSRSEEVSTETSPILIGVPEGFDVEVAAGVIHRVKLRRTLHHGAPIGVTITTRGNDRRSTIEQYDVSPRLDTLSRATVQDVLLRSYLLLREPENFAAGKARLEELTKEGFCIGCRFTALSPLH